MLEVFKHVVIEHVLDYVHLRHFPDIDLLNYVSNFYSVVININWQIINKR